VISSGESVPLQPNIIAGQGISALGDESMYWDLLEDESADKTVLLVETGEPWKEAISQAS